MKRLVSHEQTDAPESKNQTQHQRILQILAKKKKALTVHEIAAALDFSVPTGIKLMNEMVDNGAVSILGKRETNNGRKPNIYGIDKSKLYTVSVEILLKRITVAILDLDFNIIYIEENKKFKLENTEKCLQETTAFIQRVLAHSEIKPDCILGVGVGITGRFDLNEGKSGSYFTFLEESLIHYFKKILKLDVFIDNDTRCLGRAENILGKAKNSHNAIIINLSRGLGSSLIVNNQMVTGGNGFAGEIGHMQFTNSNRICICGKTGCIGNEVGGFALEETFKDSLKQGELSLLKISETFRYDQILEFATNGDVLSITLLQEMGKKLGMALGSVINLLNPEQVIIGGKFTKVQNIIGDAIRSGMLATALVNPLKNCKIEFSELGDSAGIKGAGALVYQYYNLI